MTLENYESSVVVVVLRRSSALQAGVRCRQLYSVVDSVAVRVVCVVAVVAVLVVVVGVATVVVTCRSPSDQVSDCSRSSTRLGSIYGALLNADEEDGGNPGQVLTEMWARVVIVERVIFH